MTRPAHYADYEQLPEIVPGVFIEAEAGIYIVDDVGEVVMWSPSEWEDPSAVSAALHAVALAAKQGAAAVRRNLETQGTVLARLILETAEVVNGHA